MADKPIRIVILGAGFAGTEAAVQLEKIFQGNPRFEITLVDQENFSLFTPLLPEVPSGSIQPTHIVSPLRARLRSTVIRQAEVKSIDLSNKIVLAGHCPVCKIYTMEFDHLVLALGGVTNFFGLPGVEANALTMKSLADATSLHARAVSHFEHADSETDPRVRRELLTFVVAGGGFAGVETAAELNDFVRGAQRYYPSVRSDEVRVVLVHPGDRILPEVSESLSAYALKKLRGKGIEVELEDRIEQCDESVVCLAGGKKISSRTLIWTAGISPNPLLGKLDLPRDARGRVEADATLQAKNREGIWALGDCAAILNPATGKPCPPTAQFAIRQGREVARNIAAVIRGDPPKPFRYKPVGLLAGLGRRSAVAEVFGLKFSGIFAWWLWRTIYLMKLPGLERKVRVAVDWTLDLFFPRDIVYLWPLTTRAGTAALSEERPMLAATSHA